MFLIAAAWSSDKPRTRSVMYEDEAMADPHPNVLNLTSEMMPLSSTLIMSFMTVGFARISKQFRSDVRESGNAPSPQAGAPTRPDPTLMSFLSSEPTCHEGRQTVSEVCTTHRHDFEAATEREMRRGGSARGNRHSE